MIEVAYLVAKKRKVVLVISGIKGPGSPISNEPISKIEYEDLTFGQLTLQYLVERHGVPVFNEIETALIFTEKVLRDNISPQISALPQFQQSVHVAHLQNSNWKNWICSHLQKAFDSLDTSKSGEIHLADVKKAYLILTNRELTKTEVEKALDGLKDLASNISSSQSQEAKTGGHNCNGVNGTKLNFDQFCCIMSELIHHRYRNSSRNNSGIPSGKTEYFVKNISSVLSRLLENVPSSKASLSVGNSSSEKKGQSHDQAVYDVYLGGDCTPDDNWRTEKAIPRLEENKLTYYNPEVNSLCRRFVPIDASTVENYKVLFFNIPSTSRSVENMLTASYYYGLGYEVVLCIEHLKDDCTMDDEKEEISFWFATGGAGFCLSRALAKRMSPVASGGKFTKLCDTIQLPDDVTMGYIAGHLLGVTLTVIPQFHSHYETMRFLDMKNPYPEITFSYVRYMDNSLNTLEIDGFSEEEDPTRFLSLHCILFPNFSFCPKNRR